MATNSTLLCIHRNPSALSWLAESGYELLTAANGHDGLRIIMSRPVDAIVLEYHLGPLNGSVIAATIKEIRPELPIVMLADHTELPDDALKPVDVLVSTSDPPHFLWAAVHFLLQVKPYQGYEATPGAQTFEHSSRPSRPRGWAHPSSRSPLAN